MASRAASMTPHQVSAWASRATAQAALSTRRPEDWAMASWAAPSRGRVCHYVLIFISTCSIPAMIVCIFGHVQWRRELNDRPAPRASYAHGREDLRFSRIVASETEVPNMLEYLVWSGRAVVQSDNATELYKDRGERGPAAERVGERPAEQLA